MVIFPTSRTKTFCLALKNDSLENYTHTCTPHKVHFLFIYIIRITSVDKDH